MKRVLRGLCQAASGFYRWASRLPSLPPRPAPEDRWLVRDSLGRMVRPERRVLLAGGSPVRVSAGAPGSRPQPKAEMPPARAGRQKSIQWRARKRVATSSERCSHVIVSAERCLKGPSQSCHGEGNRQQPGPERLLDLSGVWGGGTFPEKSAEQERPSPRGPKYREGVQDNAPEGRGPALIELARR